MDKGKLRDILNLNLEIEKDNKLVQNAVKVAFWCIQEDLTLKPLNEKSCTNA